MLVVARVGTGLGCWPHAVGRMWEDIPQIEKKNKPSPQRTRFFFCNKLLKFFQKCSNHPA